jgi:hypothetical protein
MEKAVDQIRNNSSGYFFIFVFPRLAYRQWNKSNEP